MASRPNQTEARPNPLQGHPKYEKVKTLGKGSFGLVQLAKNIKSGELVAIKLLQRSCIDRKYAEREIINHSLLVHPHVIMFKEAFLIPDYVCIVMEYASGGSLFHYVQSAGRLKEGVARWFFQQLVIGMDYIHKKGIANRDIKLENTLLQPVDGLPLPLVKMCDFGYSKNLHSVATSKVGTLTYMAPEVLVNADGAYDGVLADVWSCGVMLYVMLVGAYPFDTPPNTPKAMEMVKMLDLMVNCKYVIPKDLELSADVLDLLRKILVPDPEHRLTVEDIMQHPWFTTNLPPEAANMNTTFLNKKKLPKDRQSVEQILALMDEACTVSMSHLAPALAPAPAAPAAAAPAAPAPAPAPQYAARHVDPDLKRHMEEAVAEEAGRGNPGLATLRAFIKEHRSPSMRRRDADAVLAAIGEA